MSKDIPYQRNIKISDKFYLYHQLNDHSMKNILLGIIFGFSFSIISAQNIPSPSEFLGYELGTQFTRHHQVVSYFNAVAAATEQVRLSSWSFWIVTNSIDFIR